MTIHGGIAKNVSLALLAAAVPLQTGELVAQVDLDPAPIVDEIERRVSGYESFTAGLTMTLRGEDGSERERVMEISGLEIPEGGDKTLVVFREPRDLQGTSILTVSHADAPSEQWLYLPALRRTRRIASSSHTDAFMGSEFTYEDIGSQDLRRYSYRYVRGEAIDGSDMHVLEREPLDENSGYSRQVLSVDTQEYRIRHIEYFDRDGQASKTLALDGYERYEGDQWRPARMVMQDLESGRSTILEWSDYAFRTGLEDSDFDPRRLGR